MKEIGYGVLIDGKPSGIWPKPWQSASNYAFNQEIYHPDKEVTVVPIFVGAPIPRLPYKKEPPREA